MGYFQVIVRDHGTGMTASEFSVSFTDIDGTTDAFLFPTRGLTTTADSTFQVSLLLPVTQFIDGGDGIMDLQHITGWAVGGDLGRNRLHGRPDHFGGCQ